MRSGSRTTWPGTDADALRWLADRGGAEDRALDEAGSAADVLLAARLFGWTDDMVGHSFADALVGYFDVRRARTTSKRIGSLAADLARDAVYERIVRPLRRDVVLIAAVITAGWLLGAGILQVALIALMVPFLGRRTPIGVVIAGVAIFCGLSTWWLPLLCLMTSMTFTLAWPLHVLLRSGWQNSGPVLGFLSWKALLTLAVRGRLALFATAVDAGVSDNSEIAQRFMNECGPVSAECEAVLEMCRATIAFRRGGLDEAIAAAARARAVATTPRVRGWCALKTAPILLASGRENDALSTADEAVRLLCGRRARRWHRAALLMRQELKIESTGLAEALHAVHGFRWLAVRAHDTGLLVRTERWLARLMLRHGLSENVAWALRRAVASSDGRSDLTRTREETAAELILRARVSIGDPDQVEPARADATAALALLDARTRPLAAVNARLVLAEICETEGDVDEALAHATEALSVATRARYQLPSSKWRAQWSSRQLDVFATALRLADKAGDSASAAEMIESARGEVLPANVTTTDTSLLGLLDQFTTATTTPGATQEDSEQLGSALTMAGFSPVTRPPVACVRGGRLPVDEDADSFDLNERLHEVGGRCWYWSAVLVADRYYWAVRTPDGWWTHGWAAMGPNSRSRAVLARLTRAVPIEQPGESHEEMVARVLAGPLGRPSEPGAELRLLADVAQVLLPEPLRAGLADDLARDRRLVVSLPAALSHVPVAWLPLSVSPEVRVVDKAVVVHVPGWAVLARCTSRQRAHGGQGSVRAALVNPDGASDISQLSVPPPGVTHATARAMSKKDIGRLLNALADDRDWLLYVVGHMVGQPGVPSLHGLEVAGAGLDGVLTIHDLLSGPDEDQPSFPMPSRVLVVGCDSMGMATGATDEGTGAALTNEWLGFSAALLLAGADHICCTVYPVQENQSFLRFAHLLAERLAGAADPATAVAELQRARLDQWRKRETGLPFLWQSFVYIGRG